MEGYLVIAGYVVLFILFMKLIQHVIGTVIILALITTVFYFMEPVKFEEYKNKVQEIFVSEDNTDTVSEIKQDLIKQAGSLLSDDK